MKNINAIFKKVLLVIIFQSYRNKFYIFKYVHMYIFQWLTINSNIIYMEIVIRKARLFMYILAYIFPDSYVRDSSLYQCVFNGMFSIYIFRFVSKKYCRTSIKLCFCITIVWVRGKATVVYCIGWYLLRKRTILFAQWSGFFVRIKQHRLYSNGILLYNVLCLNGWTSAVIDTDVLHISYIIVT